MITKLFFLICTFGVYLFGYWFKIPFWQTLILWALGACAHSASITINARARVTKFQRDNADELRKYRSKA